MIRLFPFAFILLWSSAFITTKPIVDNSEPFTALCFRFFFVALGFLIFSIFTKKIIFDKKNYIIQSIFSGVLFHGFYLGGVFFSVSKGLPTGMAALIVTLQPILTNALAGPILKEKVTWKQWIGVVLGFVGAALVLGFDVGSALPVIGILAAFVALIAITSSTLWQKKLSNNLPLSVSNMYQAIGGCLFHLIVILLFVDPYINFTKTFIIAMSHQIFLVSFGAFTILMYLIKNNSSAAMAWLFLNESLTSYDIIGFLIASFGVFIATRENK